MIEQLTIQNIGQLCQYELHTLQQNFGDKTGYVTSDTTTHVVVCTIKHVMNQFRALCLPVKASGGVSINVNDNLIITKVLLNFGISNINIMDISKQVVSPNIFFIYFNLNILNLFPAPSSLIYSYFIEMHVS